MQNNSFLKWTANVIGKILMQLWIYSKLFTSHTRNILYEATLHVDMSNILLPLHRSPRVYVLSILFRTVFRLQRRWTANSQRPGSRQQYPPTHQLHHLFHLLASVLAYTSWNCCSFALLNVSRYKLICCGLVVPASCLYHQLKCQPTNYLVLNIQRVT